MEIFRSSYQIPTIEDGSMSRSLPSMREDLVILNCDTHNEYAPITRDSKNDCDPLV